MIYTFDLLRDNPALLNNIGSILTDDIESWSAPDDFTVVFKFKVVHTPALYLLANQLIVPQHIWKDVKDPVTFTNENPVGTGPFTEVTKFEDQIYHDRKEPALLAARQTILPGIALPRLSGQ